jgi:hypothetical protein
MPDASHEPAATAAALAHARGAIAAAAERLRAAGARSEVLAEFVPERRVLGVRRAARMRALGRVWRLGVLLVPADGEAASIAPAFALGQVVRAEPPTRRSVVANAVAEHRALRVAAVKGGIPAGETVVFDAVPLRFAQPHRFDETPRPDAPAEPHPLGAATGAEGAAPLPDTGPLVLQGRRVLVRWNPTQPGALAPFDRYLEERVELLVDPAGGAEPLGR